MTQGDDAAQYADADPHTFTVPTADGNETVLEGFTKAEYHHRLVDQMDKCEWFVLTRWLYARSLPHAVHETGFFGLQNTVCRPASAKWRTTVARLN